jgi:hypothetical protein
VTTWDPLIKTPANSSKWFKPNWIDENEYSLSDHGEFQSPVWLAIVLAVMADRDADRAFRTSSRRQAIPGTLHDARGGHLRELLACVAGSRAIAGTSRRSTSGRHSLRVSPSTPTGTDTREIVALNTRPQWRPFRTVTARIATILRAVK